MHIVTHSFQHHISKVRTIGSFKMHPVNSPWSLFVCTVFMGCVWLEAIRNHQLTKYIFYQRSRPSHFLSHNRSGYIGLPHGSFSYSDIRRWGSIQYRLHIIVLQWDDCQNACARIFAGITIALCPLNPSLFLIALIYTI